MKKITLLILLLFLSIGCATTQDVPTNEILDVAPVEVEVEEPTPAPDVSPELQNVKDADMEEYIAKNGIVFAKTAFEGVLETSYVRLTFEGQGDNKHTFQLHIGEKGRQTSFPWEVKTVSPGYFFIELPAGAYKITSISIPVGSTMATEDIDISLEVLADQITYIGTLNAVGTKEKIKLGGVPVIKPGFEYTVKVIDEQEEGEAAFRQQYPNVPNKIVVKLMEVTTAPEEK